jgi:hypothetical protein
MPSLLSCSSLKLPGGDDELSERDSSVAGWNL